MLKDNKNCAQLLLWEIKNLPTSGFLDQFYLKNIPPYPLDVMVKGTLENVKFPYLSGEVVCE